MNNTNTNKPLFRNSQEAFEDAILYCSLSTDPTSPRYAGDYMYMHTEELADNDILATHEDLFKNRNTREYIRVPAWL